MEELMEHIAEGVSSMGDGTLKSLVISQSLIIAVFIIKMLVDYVVQMNRSRSQEDKEKLRENDGEIKALREQLSVLQASVSAIAAKLDLCVSYMFKIPEIEKEIGLLESKLRTFK